MKIEKGIELYLEQVKRNNAKDTLECYSGHLEYFARWCDQSGIRSFEQFRSKEINKFIDHMKLTCCNLTINKRIRIIKNINQSLDLRNKYIDAVPRFAEQRKVFNMIELEDLKRIREYVKSNTMKESNALMYKLMFLILMDTGMRRSELIKIERENVDLHNLEIKLVQTKNHDERIVYFTKVTAGYIKLMLQLKVDHGLLMHNMDKNRAMNLYDVEYVIKKYKQKFNMKELHPHMFRHSFITLWLQNGATTKEVKEVSGIKTPEVLDRYWHLAKNQAKKSYNLNYKLD